MASTSASSIQKRFKYDVFLSFRGEDTRKNFVDHLYHALKQRSIITYRDDEEIKKGERISNELIRSIEDSKIYIIVFSKNYASSSWCLDELVKIMECQKTNERIAYPVFYDVEPTEVRNQSGAVGEAFTKHVKAEAARRWRDALKEAAGLAGRELKNCFDGHEAKFIQKIVEEISLELRFIDSSVDGKLVGMETRVNDVVSSLEIDIDDVRMIGIKGMGGSGKTTLARAVFNKISYRFEGSSFVENVREISKNPLCGLKLLQKQVVSDVLNDPHITIKDESDLKKRMCGRKVLVVLDDVDNIDQLEALAGQPNWFKPGSRVIITTRDEQVLVAHRVNLIRDVNLLSYEEAICLFIKYAFGREMPNQGYKKLSDQVVRYAAGLPLTIKVLGSFLCGKDELEWKDALERLETIPLKETMEILELSYECLEEEYQEIFLDVACILKGWKKEKAIRVLESCEFHARSGLRVLEQKSLITVCDRGRLSMHDHIEEMGKNIVRRLHPNEPYRHSRLWIEEEIEDIRVKDKCTEAATRCLKVKLVFDQVNRVTAIKGLQKTKGDLRKMKNLRFLNVIIKGGTNYNDDGYDSERGYTYGNHYFQSQRSLPNGLGCLCWNGYPYKCLSKYFQTNDLFDLDDYLPNGLQYLSWIGYPYKCLPKYFQANNLVGLEISYSNIEQLWKGGERKALKKLRFLDLCFCKLKTLNIGLLVNLERLHLAECRRLVELHMPVESYKLKDINLCSLGLKTLNLEHAQNLDSLKVRNCRDLVEVLHMPVDLKHFSLLGCPDLKILNLTRTRNLETLNLEHENLVELHMPAEMFKLKSLTLGGFHLMSSSYIGRGNHLNELNIKKNDNLVEHYPIKNLKFPRLKFCFEMKTLNLTQTRNLEALYLLGCNDLLELHMPVESPELETINIVDSYKLRTLNLTGTCNVEVLGLLDCAALLELHMPIESAKLKIIIVTCSMLTTLNLIRTRNLERLCLEKCEHLVELRMPIESPNLKTISIRCSKLRTLNLNGTRNLERLYLVQCDDLVEVHMPIESLELKTINIHCSKLRTLYLGLSPYLDCLDLHACSNLVEIHAPVGCLSGRVRFKSFSGNQGFPMISNLAELHLIARSLGICPLHPHNSLPKFHFECIYKELLLSSIQNLAKLIRFGLCACTNLASLSGIICHLHLRKLTLEGSIPEVPKEINQLECLEELTLLSTNIEHLPDSICMLKYLKFLQLESCGLLKQLPKDLGRLECLEELTLFSTKIEYLPDGICMLKKLKFLQLKSCWFLKQLPEDLGRLECLEELCLTDCTSLRDIPNSICELKLLKCFRLTNCILVENLPKEIGGLKCLKELNIHGTGIIDPPQSIFELEGASNYRIRRLTGLLIAVSAILLVAFWQYIEPK